MAFIAIGSGAIGCVAAGIWADRWGKARVAGGALAVERRLLLAAGVLYGGPLWVLIALAVVWGFAIVADSAQFSALVTEHTPRTHVGTALTLQTSAGFLLTMVSIHLLPLAAGAHRVAVDVPPARARPGPGMASDEEVRLNSELKNSEF